MSVYDIHGTDISGGGGGGSITIDTTGNDSIVKSISHMGTLLNNKLQGYINAKKAGFQYGENDINFTSDGYVIMRHDGTISVDGVTTNIASMTYAELMAVDPDIPTLQEWLECMKCISLIPYIDTKRWSGTWSAENLQNAVGIVKDFGYADKCTWLIGAVDEADIILAGIPNARIGLLQLPTTSYVTSFLAKKTDANDLFFDSFYGNLTSEHIQTCKTNNIPLEVYTITTRNEFETAYAVSDYISGFTCNGTINPSAILTAKYITS